MFKKIIILFLSVFSAFITAETLHGNVVKIADGDTFTLLVDGSTQYKIRLVEIDAPESNQPYGQKSKKILSDLISRENVTIDVSSYDRYGRALGRVYVGDLDVNRQMVRVGAAWVYLQYVKDRSLLIDETAAQRERSGIWSLSIEEQIPPWKWRSSGR